MRGGRRAVARALLALAPVFAPAAAWSASTRGVPSVPVESGSGPLALLSSALAARGPVSGLAQGLPQGLPAVPAALAPERAQVLLERAAESGAPAPPGRPEQARSALLAVNATLRDFAPEELASLPAERLHGLASVVLDQLRPAEGAPSASYLDGLKTLALRRTARMLGLRGRPLEETLHNPGHTDMHPDDLSIKGLPEEARLVLPEAEARPGRRDRSFQNGPVAPDTVFRYYAMKEDLPAILSGSSLWNGFVSYVQVSPYLYHKSYDDATGLFLTLPGVKGSEVGVPDVGGMAREAFVDLVLPAGLPLWDLEKGIFMVPLPRRSRGWVLDYYLKWLSGGDLADHNRRMAARLDAEGGPGPSLRVPVRIVGHGQTR